MHYIDFGIVQTVRRLLTDFATYREELRTERFLNTLPDHVLKDIGWPDAYAQRLARRGSMKEVDAGKEKLSVDVVPLQLAWPKRRETGKASKSGHFKLEY